VGLVAGEGRLAAGRPTPAAGVVLVALRRTVTGGVSTVDRAVEVVVTVDRRLFQRSSTSFDATTNDDNDNTTNIISVVVVVVVVVVAAVAVVVVNFCCQAFAERFRLLQPV